MANAPILCSKIDIILGYLALTNRRKHMSFTYQERLSDSPFVETIWQTQSESAGQYMVAADGSWDILVIKQGGDTQISAVGAASQAAPLFYEPGIQFLGIRFKIGTYIPQMPGNHMLDSMSMFPRATQNSFWFHDAMLRLPDFDNVETFISHLTRNGLLKNDDLVEAALQGDMPYASLRSVQRHFLKTTGLSLSYIQYIERARQAADLLQQGVSILDTVHTLGYTDQAHLTKALKRLIGQTPAQISRVT